MARKPAARFLAPAFILLLVAGLLGIVLSGHSSEDATPIRNVLLISIDTCRADHLSCYGYRRSTTPHIDALARDGVLFENAISPVPLTLPAHASMLTGTLPPNHGIHDNLEYRLGQPNLTLAEVLKDRGFATGAVISTFVLDSRFGLDQGFDVYEDRFEETHTVNGLNERKADEATRVAIDWLADHRDKPFFLFLHYYDPHLPYDPPHSFASKFPESPYAGEIAYTDDCIGQVVAHLKDLGLFDSMLIIVAGDHGELLGEHGEDDHGYFIYQGALKVPLVFRVPGSGISRRIKAPVGLIDVVPTVCALLGVELPQPVQGKDLSSILLEDTSAASDRLLYCESLTPTKYRLNSLLGVVTNRWKLVQTTRPELYDLTNDPGETINLYTAEPAVAGELQAALRQLLAERPRRPDDQQPLGIDEQDRRRLESLGYIATSSVVEDFDFDRDKDDPKDWIDFHKATAQAVTLWFQGRRAEARRLCKRLLQLRPDFVGGQLQMARMHFEDGDHDAALPYLRRAIQLDPTSARARHRLGMTLEAMGEIEEATRSWRHALQIDPNMAETHAKLGVALAAQGQTEDAMRHLRRAVEIDPEFAQAHGAMGNLLLSQARAVEAIPHLRRALALNPKLVDAQYNLALALKAQGDNDGAIRSLQEVLRLKPDMARAHYNLASLLVTTAKPNEALGHYRRVLQIEPDNAGAQLDLARLLAAAGSVEMAVDHYLRAVDLHPGDATAHYDLALALRSLGRVDEAIDHLHKALQICPDYAQAHSNLGTLLQLRAQFDAAITHYNDALRLDPAYADAHSNLANALILTGKPTEAIAHCRQALQLNPQLFSAHFNWGEALVATAHPEEAVNHFREALRLQPQFPACLTRLAWILATHPEPPLHDPAEAVRLAEQAAALTHNQDVSALDTLAAAYAATGEFAQAVAMAETALRLARAAGDHRRAAQIHDRLALYRGRHAYREDH